MDLKLVEDVVRLLVRYEAKLQLGYRFVRKDRLGAMAGVAGTESADGTRGLEEQPLPSQVLHRIDQTDLADCHVQQNRRVLKSRQQGVGNNRCYLVLEHGRYARASSVDLRRPVLPDDEDGHRQCDGCRCSEQEQH